MIEHKSVLKEEVLNFLNLKEDGLYADVTLGLGGHSLSILEKARGAKLLGLDLHLPSLKIASRKLEKYKERVILKNENFCNLKRVLEEIRWKGLNGILADLGLSRYEIEESGLGFSFRKDEELDMNLSGKGKKAKDILNNASQKELERILKEYGEEPYAKKIARRIVEERKKKPISTTKELADIVLEEKKKGSKKIHPATQTFMALRIAVNSELENLKKFIPQAIEVLFPSGRLLIISFHSLEDRIVKNSFKKYSGKCYCGQDPCICFPEKKGKIVTKKPVTPNEEEKRENPLSRSAKLRVFEKL
ncbi:MAG: 16S rRNA (cytosine(1402)-N(4))-methyltransferase RsmH [Thermoanaerobaculia bacterium]